MHAQNKGLEIQITPIIKMSETFASTFAGVSTLLESVSVCPRVASQLSYPLQSIEEL